LVEVPPVHWKRNPEERLAQAIELRMEFYRCGALDALYDLAMLTITADGNSNMAQIKYLAARALAGPMPGEGAGGNPGNPDLNSLLSKLNDSYHSTAPRIKAIRERTVTFEEPVSVPALDSGTN
jgi:hypothetical protein